MRLQIFALTTCLLSIPLATAVNGILIHPNIVEGPGMMMTLLPLYNVALAEVVMMEVSPLIQDSQ
jgi:hypothetical protein